MHTHKKTATQRNLSHPRCLACGGSGYAEVPKATDTRVEGSLGTTGLSITRTVYEGSAQVYYGHFIRLEGKHVPVIKVDDQWIVEDADNIVTVKEF